MKTVITFRRMKGTEELKNKVKFMLSKLDKHFPAKVDAYVVLEAEKHRHNVEIALQSPGTTILANAETDDIGTALDKAIASVTRQVKKRKQKLRNYRGETKRV